MILTGDLSELLKKYLSELRDNFDPLKMIKFPAQTLFKVLEIKDISRPRHSQDVPTNPTQHGTSMLLITDGHDKYRALEREKLSLTLMSKLLLQNVQFKNDILLLTRENVQ